MKKTSMDHSATPTSLTGASSQSGFGPSQYTVPEPLTGTAKNSILYPSVWRYESGLNEAAVKAIDDLLTRVRAHGYVINELEASGLKMKLQYIHDEPLSPGERLQMRRAGEDSYGARTARVLGVTDE